MEVKSLAQKKAEFEAEVKALGIESQMAVIKDSLDDISSVFGKPAGVRIETTKGKQLWPR